MLSRSAMVSNSAKLQRPNAIEHHHRQSALHKNHRYERRGSKKQQRSNGTYPFLTHCYTSSRHVLLVEISQSELHESETMSGGHLLGASV